MVSAATQPVGTTPRAGNARGGGRAAVPVILTLVVGTLVAVVHWPALAARATNTDDGQYLLENRLVQNPSWHSVGEFFGKVLEPSTVGGYYQPVAMTSLMLDWAMGGRADQLRPFHCTSLALHVVNTALVIVFLYMLFGSPWTAALVGLLFGVHPLTVEPIPWVGERKTLLAAFFSLWCLILYVRYTRRPGCVIYSIALVGFVLALLSKPTSTPLPALLLLLDYWPLRRLTWRAVAEKIPYLLVGGISAIITYISQARTAAVAVMPYERGPLQIPFIICHNIVFYFCKMIWPTNLTSHYPFPEPLSLEHPMVLAGAIGTTVLVIAVLISLRWTRMLLAGGLFFFVCIFPTLGVITFTTAIACDKYVYLPVLGLLMILTFALGRIWNSGISRRGTLLRRGTIVIAVLLLAALEARGTRHYLVHWKDTETLYRYMLTFDPLNDMLHDYLGVQLQDQRRVDDAITEFSIALQINPMNHSAYNNLGVAFAGRGQMAEALRCFAAAVQCGPTFARGYGNLGRALAALGRADEARPIYEKALALDPYCLDAHQGLAVLLATQGQLDQAAAHFRTAIQVNANYVEAYIGLGRVLLARGRLDESVGILEAAARMAPGDARIRADLERVRAKRAAAGSTPAHQ